VQPLSNIKCKYFGHGFTLIEMMIVIVIIGLIISSSLFVFSSITKQFHDRKTEYNIQEIADFIAIYVEKHMRVPCPADPLVISKKNKGGEPFGAERGSGEKGLNFGSCNTLDEAEGIVPFLTLGLSKDTINDGYGNLITYRISITSAQSPSQSRKLPISNWCMTRPHWYDDTNDDGVSDTYINLEKAAFCCGTWMGDPVKGVEGDIQIQRNNEEFSPYLLRSIRRGGHYKEYRKYTKAPPTYEDLTNSSIPNINDGKYTVPPSFPAYILISHGQNGHGVFNDQTGRRSKNDTKSIEKENVDGDNVYMVVDADAVQKSFKNKKYMYDFDDILFWETPSQILNRLENQTCARP